MRFDKIVGGIDPKIVAAAEEKMTSVFLELGTSTNNYSGASGLGGDALVFSLLVPAFHYATDKIPTAATNGKFFFWSPSWIVKQSPLGLRLTCYHEASHALLMHPQRIGKRHPLLWNIAVDLIVNGWLFDDLILRFRERLKTQNKPIKAAETMARKAFIDGLGNFCTLEQTLAMFRDPKAKVPGMEKWKAEKLVVDNARRDFELAVVSLPAPDDERELTSAEKELITKQQVSFKYFYADPNIPEEMRKPELIYEALHSACPSCPDCGKLGMYIEPANSKPADPNKKAIDEEAKKSSQPTKNGQTSQLNQDAPNASGDDCDSPLDADDEGVGEEQQQSRAGKSKQAGGSGDSKSSGATNQQSNTAADDKVGRGGCGTCEGAYNVLDFGSTLDEHLETVENADEMMKRFADAVETANAMAGNVPAGLKSEMGELSKPRISFPDFLRTQLSRARKGNGRNDWSRFKSRPMSFGLLIPRRKGNTARFICLLDTSASMTPKTKALGISQLQSLDERGEGTLICGDAKIYWEEATKLRRCNAEELSRMKLSGGGGTVLHSFFTDYEKKLGKADFIVVISDCQFDPKDEEKFEEPKGAPVFWLMVGGGKKWKAPFGKVFELTEDRY